MERSQMNEEENEESYTDTLVDVIVLPLVRGLSFGVAHLLVFTVIAPKVFKSLK